LERTVPIPQTGNPSGLSGLLTFLAITIPDETNNMGIFCKLPPSKGMVYYKVLIRKRYFLLRVFRKSFKPRTYADGSSLIRKSEIPEGNKYSLSREGSSLTLSSQIRKDYRPS
jgi:hypothetical protein